MWKKQLLDNNWSFKDVISVNKIRQLDALLPFATRQIDQLPLSYHFMYLIPSSLTRELDKDGYDSYQSPPQFIRRLWVGGSVEQYMPILINSEICLNERIRKIREFNDSVLVEIERSIVDANGVCLKELRKLMYLNTLYSESKPRYETEIPEYTKLIKLSPTDLIRYSSLTYNSHKIHYDINYALQENYPSLLVHGPLLVTLSINFAQYKMNSHFNNIVYKNIRPVFISDDLVMNLSNSDGGCHVWITNQRNELCCSSIIN